MSRSRRHVRPHGMPLIPVTRRPEPPRVNALEVLQAAEQLHRDGQLDAALKGYRHLMEHVGPTHVIGLRAAYMTALCAHQKRLYHEAILLMQAVRERNWENAEVHYNLGLFHHAVAELEEAAESYRTALALKPDMAAAENNLGNCLREMGDTELATMCFDRLLSRNPTDPDARYNLAYITLLRGMLGQGFRHYEARWECVGFLAEYARHDITSPRLPQGAAPCTVFVHQEQGIGDTLQFLRYLPRLQALGHRVIFEAPIELGDWFEAVLPTLGVECIRRGTPIPAHDYHLPLMTLAPTCGTETEADIPPVLRPPVRKASPLYTVPGDARRVVGVCWAGNAKHHNDRHRSTTLEALAPLFLLPNTRFVSLQIGARGVDLFAARPELGAGSELVDCSAGMADFEATAALILDCGAVVTVDTSIAHLAGTLGVRTLILTSWLSEWRWQLDRTDSPWYPSVELVRQPTLGDWPAAAERARQLLEER